MNNLTEKQLELTVQNFTLGTLVTDAERIKTAVSEGISRYSIENYNSDNIDGAKKDKALLNKAAKTLNDKRIELEKQFMSPFLTVKNTIAETCELIKTASNAIDMVVKESDVIEKADKRKTIEALYSAIESPILALERVFDDRWLNKSVSIKMVYAELKVKFDSILSDLGTIESMEEMGFEKSDTEGAKAVYFRNLKLTEAMEHLKIVKSSREAEKQRQERIQQQEAEKQRLTEVAQVETAKVIAPEVMEVIEVKPQEPTPTVVINPEVLTRAFKVTATKDAIIALGDFMNERGICFEKIEI